MSIRANTTSNKITTSSTLMLIEKNALKVLLYNAYDDLTNQAGRKAWFAISTAILGAGGSGLIDWFCGDVATAESLIQFDWVCTKSVVYGLLLFSGLVNVLIYWATASSSKKNNRNQFIDSRMEDKSFMVINQPYQVTTTSIKLSASNSTSIKTIKLDENGMAD